MTDYERLDDAIKKSDYTVGVIAKKAGMTRQSFHNKRTGKREFAVHEILALCKVLNITNKEREKIFFK